MSLSLSEAAILAVMAETLILIAIRCFGIQEGKVLKRYQTGKAQLLGDRQVQEDYYCISRTPQGLLAVLADGKGRNYGGKIAGKIAAETIDTIFNSAKAFENPLYFFKRSFHAANREILKEIENGGSASVAAVIIQENLLYYALVGNIKVAVFRNGQLVQLSAGHTLDVLAKEQYSRGSLSREDAKKLMESHRLYNHLGQDGFQDIEFLDAPVTLRARDIVVLMSEGVFEEITWKDIEECLGHNKNCQAKAMEIMELINASSNKDKDNASIVMVEQP